MKYTYKDNIVQVSETVSGGSLYSIIDSKKELFILSTGYLDYSDAMLYIDIINSGKFSNVYNSYFYLQEFYFREVLGIRGTKLKEKLLSELKSLRNKLDYKIEKFNNLLT